MKEIIKKIKLYSSRFFKKDISYKKQGIRPVYDWNIMLISTSIILFIMVSISLYFYIEISNGKLFTIPENSSSIDINLNQKLLKQTVDKFDTNLSIFDGIKKNNIAIPDPSI